MLRWFNCRLSYEKDHYIIRYDDVSNQYSKTIEEGVYERNRGPTKRSEIQMMNETMKQAIDTIYAKMNDYIYRLLCFVQNTNRLMTSLSERRYL